MAIRIELSRGLHAWIDEEDFDLVSRHKWYAQRGGGGHFYAARTGPRSEGRPLIYLHRILISARDGECVDHANGDTLDNRRANLRVGTCGQNSANMRLHPRNNSGFKGVYWRGDIGKWASQIQVNGRGLHLGVFGDVKEAAEAYDQAAVGHFGQFACTNRMLGLL